MFVYKNKPIDRGRLFETLINAPNVTDVEWIDHYKSGYSRTLKFIVENTTYRIEWWKNVSYLNTANDLQIPFEYVEVSGTWPNGYKTNLQFYRDGEVVAILPLEEYGVE